MTVPSVVPSKPPIQTQLDDTCWKQHLADGAEVGAVDVELWRCIRDLFIASEERWMIQDIGRLDKEL